MAEAERIAYLRAAVATLRLRAAYQATIRAVLNVRERDPGFLLDRKKRRAYRTLLEQEDGQFVLSVIWKEGDHVSDEACAVSGTLKLFSASVESVNALSKRLLPDLRHNDIDAIDALKKKIEGIVNAAIAYDLVKRVRLENGASGILACEELDAVFRSVATIMERGPDVETLAPGLSPDRAEYLHPPGSPGGCVAEPPWRWPEAEDLLDGPERLARPVDPRRAKSADYDYESRAIGPLSMSLLF